MQKKIWSLVISVKYKKKISNFMKRKIIWNIFFITAARWVFVILLFIHS